MVCLAAIPYLYHRKYIKVSPWNLYSYGCLLQRGPHIPGLRTGFPRWPVIEPMIEYNSTNDYIILESFLLASHVWIISKTWQNRHETTPFAKSNGRFFQPVRRQAIIWTNAGILLIGDQTSVKFYSEFKHFHSRNAHKNVICELAFILSRPQFVKCNHINPPNLSIHCDVICRRRSCSTLVQVKMACCLTAPIHYLNQCWLIINNNFKVSTQGIKPCSAFKS